MIPQRNLSLLANRLAREEGHRLREDVLERDYCLAWLLAGIAESEIKGILGFKGGTALKRCYFGDYRFSEDLDFTLIEPVPPEELVRRLETVYAAVREASGIVFTFDREDRHAHANSYTFYLRYEGPLPRGNDVKVDITLREHLVYPLQERPILRGYEEFADLPENRLIRVYSLAEIATEKTIAPQTPLSARFPRLGAARQSRTLHALGGFYSPEAVDLEPGPRQVSGLQRFPPGGKTSRRRELRDQPRDRAPHLACRQTGVAAEAPVAPVSLSPATPPTLRHDGAHRCQPS